MSNTPGMSRSTPVVILGMHRSGTSCLAGSMQQIGLYLGKVFEQNRANLKGNRENQVIASLNDAVLEESGGNWRKVPDTLIWNARHVELRQHIIGQFRKINKPFWGFKDPRALVTYPFWQEALPDMKTIGTFRHPLVVAESLNRRDNEISLPEGLNLWQTYNEKLLTLLLDKPFPLVCFDVSKSEYLSQVNRIAAYLGMECTVSDLDFFDDALRNQRRDTGDEVIPEHINSLYEQLLFIYRDQQGTTAEK